MPSLSGLALRRRYKEISGFAIAAPAAAIEALRRHAEVLAIHLDGEARDEIEGCTADAWDEIEGCTHVPIPDCEMPEVPPLGLEGRSGLIILLASVSALTMLLLGWRSRA